MKSPDLYKVSFAIQAVGDVVTSIGATVYPGGTTCQSLAAISGNDFWIENNSDGIPRLCTMKAFGTQLNGVFVNVGASYAIPATNFDVLYPWDITTHPVHAPK